jgi:hypothetical protein
MALFYTYGPNSIGGTASFSPSLIFESVADQAVRVEWDSIMSDKRYLILTVECVRCKIKQKIHIANRTEVEQKGNEKVP